MPAPSEQTIKKLFALSGNICAFPGCQSPIIESSGTVTGEICHICARSSNGPRFDEKQTDKQRHSFENLILLCRRHHKIIDAEFEVYSVDALQEMKKIHEGVVGRSEEAEDTFFAKILINDHNRISISNESGNVAVNSPGAMQANNLTVKTEKKHIKINPPDGTIGSDRRWSSYIQYLIKRYNKFASSDKTRKTKFSYGVISKNIEARYGATWKLLPLEMVEAIASYLQGRIQKTRQALINKGKGYKAFSSFEEYIEKHNL
jgi:hypothetical protein